MPNTVARRAALAAILATGCLAAAGCSGTQGYVVTHVRRPPVVVTHVYRPPSMLDVISARGLDANSSVRLTPIGLR